MEIRKLFGLSERIQNNLNKPEVEKAELAKGEGAAKSIFVKKLPTDIQSGGSPVATPVPGEDRISVSQLSKQLLQVSDVLSEDGKKQAERIAKLKQQIEDGTYSVNSDDVARSVISYAQEVQPLAEV